MFRVFPQDLKPGDTIVYDSVEANVLSLKNMDKNVEVHVRLNEGGLGSWLLNKSQMLDVLSSEEQRALCEPTIPDVREITGATIPVIKSPELNVDSEAETHPLGGIPTIKIKEVND